MRAFFVFDVESIGLHGEAFAVGGGVYLENGAAQSEFRYACPINEAAGSDWDRKWVRENCPLIEATYNCPRNVRDGFWAQWKEAKRRHPEIQMAADCAWPVEARFLAACVDDAPEERRWEGPYPLQEIASFLTAAGIDPMANHARTASEEPKHDPLADARQSARLLSEALFSLKLSQSDL